MNLKFNTQKLIDSENSFPVWTIKVEFWFFILILKTIFHQIDQFRMLISSCMWS